MDLRIFLRDPIFIKKRDDLIELANDFQAKEHAFIFFNTGTEIYPLKTHDVLFKSLEHFDQTIECLSERHPLLIIPYTDLFTRVS